MLLFLGEMVIEDKWNTYTVAQKTENKGLGMIPYSETYWLCVLRNL